MLDRLLIERLWGITADEHTVEVVHDDPGAAVEMGRAGREHVRERHLVTRALEGELRLLANTVSA